MLLLPRKSRLITCWDEELEEGDSILAIKIEEELIICTVHHANELVAAANADNQRRCSKKWYLPITIPSMTYSSKENFDELPEQKPWDHTIQLIPNAKSILDCKVYPLNRDKQEQLDKFLNENLESGRIRPSKFPFTSPLLLRQEEGWHPMPSVRLLKAEQDDDQELLPAPLDLQAH